jgi:hypothetical protein
VPFIGGRGRAGGGQRWPRHGGDECFGELQWPGWPRRCGLVLQGGGVTSVAR